MPVRRDADGRIIDELTRRVPPSDQEDPALTRRRTVDITKPAEPRGGTRTMSADGWSPATRYNAPTTTTKQQVPDPDRTVFIRRSSSAEAQDAAASDVMDDPPTGWLVVVGGPGRGNVVTLGTGSNTIGRDPSERVSLDYGDMKISRTNHGAITYDPLGRKFYVQHGGGKNLTYVGNEPVLAPRELAPLTHVRIGDTVLRFVPLCGAEFSWDDESDGE